MDAHADRYFEELCRRLAKRLQRCGFEAQAVRSREAARDLILAKIKAGDTVGVGGSVTIREVKAIEALEARGHTVFQHWLDLPEDELVALRRKELQADVFLSSTNAVTLEGELVNTDGVGNRVAAMIFGPPQVIVVAGRNKIVADREAALERIRIHACPMNNIRLGISAPCVDVGRCTDCKIPDRPCRVTTILSRRPSLTRFLVIVVNENLGY